MRLHSLSNNKNQNQSSLNSIKKTDQPERQVPDIRRLTKATSKRHERPNKGKQLETMPSDPLES